MCLIAIAHESHPDYPLLVAANRDEYYRRPTASAEFWEEAPQLLAGRDLQAGGTWLGITSHGRFAAITNHRNPPSTPAQPRSRGMLTLDFLTGTRPAAVYLEEVAAQGGEYAGFNLLLRDHSGLYYFSNSEGRIRQLEPGVYGLSNGLLDSGWPKQQQAAAVLEELLPGPVSHEQLQVAVSDRRPAPWEELPDTGLSSEMELALSSQFIVTGEYGTRATTTLAVHREGRVDFNEQSFSSGGASTDQRRHAFDLEP